MEHDRSTRAWTLIGAALLALTVGAMTRRAATARAGVPEDLRDAVASPAARVAGRDAGWFATPSSRRAEAEKTLLSSRRNRAASVSAQ